MATNTNPGLQVQKHMKLHITKELTEKDVVSRIMRKENYLIGMLNKVQSASSITSLSKHDTLCCLTSYAA